LTTTVDTTLVAAVVFEPRVTAIVTIDNHRGYYTIIHVSRIRVKHTNLIAQ